VLQDDVTWLRAEYLDYPTVDFQYYVVSDVLTPVINLRGNKLPFAPESTAALVYEHTFPFPSGGRLVRRLQSNASRTEFPDRYALWTGQKGGGWGHIRTMSPPSAH
jgi:hypothetical protein